MKATEEELKMIAEFDASEGVDKGSNIYMSDDEIIDFAKHYHTKKLILHGVSNNELALIEPLRNFIRSKHLSKEWETFLKDYERNS